MAGESSKSSGNMFTINDRASCLKAIRNGWIAALVSAGITCIFAVLGMFMTSTNDTLSYYLDPFLFIDVGLLVLIAIFIFRKSRIASTVLVVYFGISKILFIATTGKFTGIIMSVLFFSIFVMAMIGTYKWHSTYKDMTDPTQNIMDRPN